jgi:ribose transport system substrate-binding protein
VKAVVLFGLSQDVDRRAVEKLNAAHIPVVAVINPPALGVRYSGIVLQNPVALTAVLGQYIGRASRGRPIQVAMVNGFRANALFGLYTLGLTTGLKQTDPKATLVANEPGDFQVAPGQAAAQAILQAHPNLDWLVIIQDDTTVAVVRALTGQGNIKVKVVTAGGDDAVRTLVSEGKVQAISLLAVHQAAEDAINDVDAALARRPPGKPVTISNALITKQNLATAPRYK